MTQCNLSNKIQVEADKKRLYKFALDNVDEREFSKILYEWIKDYA